LKIIYKSKLIICHIIFFLFTVTSVLAQLSAITGSYIGDGTTNKPIYGLGFKPDFIFVKCDLFYAQLTTSTLPLNNTKDMNGGTPDPGVIKSLDDDGFTLGSDLKVNKANTVYNYLAVKVEPGVFEVGSYIGNSTDNRDITGTSFRPDMVIIISQDNNEKPLYSSNTMGPDQSMNFLNSGLVTDQIQAFNSNGFQVGKDKAVNVSGLKYHFIAMKHVPGKIFIGSYVGNGTDNRTITEPGKGSFTMIKMWGQHATCRMWDMLPGNSHYFKNTASVTDRIKQNTSTGFLLGMNNEVNQSGNVYHYMQILGINNALPVKLVSFEARSVEKIIMLEWQTATEQNSALFEVQRSYNGDNFETIYQVHGKGNSNELVSYNYIDSKPFLGYSYYRLKQIDIDGGFTFSEVRKILFEESSKAVFSFYPNPFRGNKIKLAYNGNESLIYLDIFNSDGKKMDSKILSNGNKILEFQESLKSGTYFLIGNNGQDIIFRDRIVKL